jgi:hypothetical protein
MASKQGVAHKEAAYVVLNSTLEDWRGKSNRFTRKTSMVSTEELKKMSGKRKPSIAEIKQE